MNDDLKDKDLYPVHSILHTKASAKFVRDESDEEEPEDSEEIIAKNRKHGKSKKKKVD